MVDIFNGSEYGKFGLLCVYFFISRNTSISHDDKRGKWRIPQGGTYFGVFEERGKGAKALWLSFFFFSPPFTLYAFNNLSTKRL